MTSNWQQWQGRTIAGKYVLDDYVGGSDETAVFRTSVDGQSAALKLISATPAGADRRLGLWKRAAGFSHPNLIRILDYGRHSADGGEFVYIVEEFAEENLSQIVPERALTGEEVRGMLPAVLDALESIHSKNLVHSRMHPANILAAGDLVKLSSDSVRPTGDIARATTPYDAPEVTIQGLSAASDVWSLGMTLAEVLTQRLPSADAGGKGGAISATIAQVPEPLRTIIGRCVEGDPGARCTIREIRDRLADRTPQVTTPVATPAMPEALAATPAVSSKETRSWKWQHLAAVAILGAAAIFLFRVHSSNSGNGEAASQSSSPQTTTQSTTDAVERIPEQGKDESRSQSKRDAALSNHAERTSSSNDVVERAMPQIAPGARHTIHGKIKVRVQVTVDAAGKVTDAKLKTAGPSRYFAHAAMEAARQWRFVPAAGAQGAKPRSWLITFGFTRGKTEVSTTPSG